MFEIENAAVVLRQTEREKERKHNISRQLKWCAAVTKCWRFVLLGNLIWNVMNYLPLSLSRSFTHFLCLHNAHCGCVKVKEHPGLLSNLDTWSTHNYTFITHTLLNALSVAAQHHDLYGLIAQSVSPLNSQNILVAVCCVALPFSIFIE